jgi:hypothetical protein
LPRPNGFWGVEGKGIEGKIGVKLTVREGRRLMLLYEGGAAEVSGPGFHPGYGGISILGKIKGRWYIDYTKTSDKRKTRKKNIHHPAARPAHKGTSYQA